MKIKPNQHEKDEWSRCARAAYEQKENEITFLLLFCAAQDEIEFSDFDRVSAIYRRWLIFDKVEDLSETT